MGFPLFWSRGYVHVITLLLEQIRFVCGFPRGKRFAHRSQGPKLKGELDEFVPHGQGCADGKGVKLGRKARLCAGRVFCFYNYG
jgi:hypothetical protein